MKRKQNSIAELVAVILLISLPASTILTGCGSVTLHPILKQDIVRMVKDTPYTPDRDGYFLSDTYVKEVMQAKVERVNLK